MQAVRSVEPSAPVIPAKDRLSLKLGLLFVGSFLAVFIILAAWTMFSTIADRQQAAANSEVAAPVIVIDPKIQTDLAKALAFDAIPASVEVLNPFVDRAGLAGKIAGTTTTAAATQTTAAAPGSGTSATIAAGGGGMTGARSNNGVGLVMMPEPYDVKGRYGDWLERKKRGGFVEPESEVLAIEDLVPVGFASGGDRQQEVILLSLSLCRTFSFPAGTRFSNGTLYGFDPTEVMFLFQNGLRSKSYTNTEPCRQDETAGMPSITGQD